MESRPASRRKLYWLLWWFAFSATSFSGGHNPKPGDAKLMCLAAQSLLHDGSLAVEPVRADIARGPDGRFYVKYPLLCVVQCVPALLLRGAARWIAPNDEALELFALAIVPHALCATLVLGFLQLALAFGARESVGTALALAVLFTTPLWASGRALYSEVLQTVLTVYAISFAVRARRLEQRSAFVLGGLVCGLAINTKILLAILPLAIAIDQLQERERRARLVRLACFALPGVLLGVVASCAYNRLRYGSFFAQGYAIQRDAALGFSVPLWSGLYGLLFSSGKSLFAYAPLLSLSLFALPRWWRSRRRDLILIAIPTLFILAVTACWWAWNGDWAWGPRLIFPIIPLLALPAIDLFDGPSKRRLAAISGVALLGFYVQLLAISVDPGRFLQLTRPVTQAVTGHHDPDRLRDDLLPIHFVPELNPILGQQWLLFRYLTRPPWNAESDYPWRSLGIPNWRPTEDPTPKRLDFWLDPNSSRSACALELSLAISTLALAAALARELGRKRRSASVQP